MAVCGIVKQSCVWCAWLAGKQSFHNGLTHRATYGSPHNTNTQTPRQTFSAGRRYSGNWQKEPVKHNMLCTEKHLQIAPGQAHRRHLGRKWQMMKMPARVQLPARVLRDSGEGNGQLAHTACFFQCYRQGVWSFICRLTIHRLVITWAQVESITIYQLHHQHYRHERYHFYGNCHHHYHLQADIFESV